ncbi:sigma 54-interacting transcriptional regulator [Geosporobacter ferrireducens]|nr:sigma 54-interacting transcriptional regulator [Geosporobacter ferrireducens]
MRKKLVEGLTGNEDNMKEKIVSTIHEEDPNNPYTDEQIAELLSINRDIVLTTRKEYSISNSRERKRERLNKELIKLLKENSKISQREITIKLKAKGFNISRFTVNNLLINAQNEISLPNYTKAGIGDDENVFKKIVGYDKSLKTQIMQAKAAVMYPPMGLHTLIVGDTGVGKSQLAEAMYYYAIDIKRISADKTFVSFNCADYAENPQLLLAQLFGYIKGAFTGATEEKTGLIDQANESILFLDEVHRLSAEGQEILFNVIDRGSYRRLGETEAQRTVSTMIIAATTEDVESRLLHTFRRRIPMVISLPSLESRTLNERLELIQLFFIEEANRTKADIIIHMEVLWALLIYDCKGNIGQLKSDIQVSCARAFLSYMISKNKNMEISISDIPINARKGLLKLKNSRKEMELLVKGNIKISYDNKSSSYFTKKGMNNTLNEIYQYIENRYKDLSKHELPDDVVNQVIGEEIESYIEELMKTVEKNINDLDLESLKNLVGTKITQITESIIHIAEEEQQRSYDKKFFFCLAMHLHSTIERLKQGKTIYNPQLDTIKKEYKSEFNLAAKISKSIESVYNISLPEDELGFLAIYLMMNDRSTYEKHERIGVVLISHGHVASNMLDVARKLLGVEYGVAIEMSMNEHPESILEKATEAAKEVNEGKGVLLLVDMGSLISFGDIIMENTGIPIKTISRTDTVTVIEAIRRAVLPGETLDNIYRFIVDERVELKNDNEFLVKMTKKKPAIVAVCVTGEGTAIKIKDIVMSLVSGIEKKCEIITLGLINEKNLGDEIHRLRQKYEIKASIGSFNIFDQEIPFFSTNDLLNENIIPNLRKIFKITEEDSQVKKSSNYPLKNLLLTELININLDLKNQNQVILHLSNLLFQKGKVSEGFYEEVTNREQIGSTAIGNMVAIPHADARFTREPAIAVATLKQAIKWGKNKVQLVFILAINENCIEALHGLVDLLNHSTYIHRLLRSDSTEKFKEVLLDAINEKHCNK